MRRWPLLRPLRALKVVVGLGLFAAIPTVGVALSCMAAAVPLWLAAAVAPGNDEMSLFAAVTGLVLWLLVAAGIGVGAVRLLGDLAAARGELGWVGVGRDGIRWTGWFGPRYARYADVESIALEDGEVRVTCRGRRTIRFAVPDPDALQRALREAHDRYQASDLPPRVGALGRGSRTIRRWLDALGARPDEPGYREGATPREVLARVASDPRADAEQRIGAAMLLSAAPERTRSRVRVAVEETADPVLADALSEALDGTLRLRSVRRALRAR